ncbi:hypothetical protein SLEP1_g45022 [Rubroshorea leprosula]|uniref:Uncharacterized protein n=1 Tax=Rubroshorea leprosula TaxID=152421 RepID=A0AAV5LJ51_9ROSI|nr:hypothetical protein SLEP1_g45022 [Rubroshorea leprosula]
MLERIQSRSYALRKEEKKKKKSNRKEFGDFHLPILASCRTW